MTEELTFGVVTEDRWPDAMTLAARSFLGEPFVVEMFGVEPVRRFALAHRFYRSSPWQADEGALGAWVGEVLVGLCLSSPPGGCYVCEQIDPRQPPDDLLSLADWRFEVNAQAAHADQGTHAWVSRVAVDPALRGVGIGRTLIVRMLAKLQAEGASAVLLECQRHREDFYVASGFRRVRTFPDLAGPEALLMRADLHPSG